MSDFPSTSKIKELFLEENMPVQSCLYLHNGQRWTQKACKESTKKNHAEPQLLDLIKLNSQLILLIQNAAPCPERCETLLKNNTKATRGIGKKAAPIAGHSIIVRIIGEHGGYVDPTTNMQYYFNGEKYNAAPVGFPPVPALPDDPVL